MVFKMLMWCVQASSCWGMSMVVGCVVYDFVWCDVFPVLSHSQYMLRIVPPIPPVTKHPPLDSRSSTSLSSFRTTRTRQRTRSRTGTEPDVQRPDKTAYDLLLFTYATHWLQPCSWTRGLGPYMYTSDVFMCTHVMYTYMCVYINIIYTFHYTYL